MPGQMNPMAMPMNPMNANTRGGAQQMHYKNSGGIHFTFFQNKILSCFLGKRGGFNKRQPGKRGGRYNKNGGYKQNQPTNVEVNDSDFPPLSNENQEGSSPSK